LTRFIKRYLKGFYMSLGMFCFIPLPFKRWDESCLNLVLPCFPLIGILLGIIWRFSAQALVYYRIHIMLASAILTVMPFILSGFLHLDGYMDTCDAIFSRRPFEEKLNILKDSHTGAFSVIMLAVLFVFQFASMYAVIDIRKNLMPLIAIPVISRCCSTLALICLKAMPQSGYGNMLNQNVRVSHKLFVIITAILTALLSYLFSGFRGLAVVLLTVLGFAGAAAYSYKEFKGFSGDLTGFSLIIKFFILTF